MRANHVQTNDVGENWEGTANGARRSASSWKRNIAGRPTAIGRGVDERYAYIYKSMAYDIIILISGMCVCDVRASTVHGSMLGHSENRNERMATIIIGSPWYDNCRHGPWQRRPVRDVTVARQNVLKLSKVKNFGLIFNLILYPIRPKDE